MKPPAPERQNVRVVNTTTAMLLLPVVFVKWLYASSTQVSRWRKTQAERDAADDLRQSRVRRQLRGLPPDHEQRPRKLKVPDVRG